ncbi:uncharacterized protein JCM6883_003644 [Sporobolomyces salmoneus]|uniref:uncharacterized protein n=1 Tax=Sporobolomyces salmoneus TaxID=183962 RepID=UPI0031779AFB
MPIPFLPTEIIAEIVSHLRSSGSQPVIDSISNGRAISLVCQRFFPIGQALRWRLVRIDSSTISSLVRHFQEFPHLARLVRIISHIAAEEEEEEEDADTFRAESLNDLLLVLSSTSLLNALRFVASVEESSSAAFTSIMQIASALPQLELFFFKIHGRVAWTPEVASTFNNGFAALRSMAAQFPDTLIIEPGLDAIPPSTPRKKLESLMASVESTVESNHNSPGLMSYLLQQLDPSALLHCVFNRLPAHDLNWELLSRCSRLTNLYITVQASHGSNIYSGLIDHLAGFRSLRTIDVDATGPEDTEDPVFETNISLQQVLAACPASFRSFKMDQLNFSDYESIPLRQLPPSLDPEPVRLSALRPDGGGDYYPFIAWKEETKEGGEVRWYRSEVEEESEA